MQALNSLWIIPSAVLRSVLIVRAEKSAKVISESELCQRNWWTFEAVAVMRTLRIMNNEHREHACNHY